MRNNRSRRMSSSPTGNMPVFRPGKAAPDSLVRRNAAGYPPSRSVLHRSIVFHNVENYAFFLFFRGKSAAFSVFSVKNSAKSRNSILFIFGFPHGSVDFPGCFFLFPVENVGCAELYTFYFLSPPHEKSGGFPHRKKPQKKGKKAGTRQNADTKNSAPSLAKNSAPKNFRCAPPAKNFAVRSP